MCGWLRNYEQLRSTGVYSLDIETLISVLQNRQIQGFVEAELAAGFAGIAGKSSVVVTLDRGKVISVTITGANGQPLYQGKEALNKIRRAVLTWQLVETTNKVPQQFSPTNPFTASMPPPTVRTQPLPPAKQPLLPAPTSSFSTIGAIIPMRQRVPSTHIHQWSRTARNVYALVNGTNSIQRIANLLSLPVDAVYAELLTLQEGHLVLLGGAL